MRRREDPEILRYALIGYQAQYDEIEGKIAEVRRELARRRSGAVVHNGVDAPAGPKVAPKKKRISKAGRARIAAATRERWRKARAAGRSRLG